MRSTEKVKLVCNNCGQPFERNPSVVIAGRRAFCSQRCYDADRPKQYDREDVLQYMVRYATDNPGHMVSYRMIGQEFGISSSSVVRHILEDLEKQGLVNLPGGRVEIVGLTVTWEDPRRQRSRGD